MSPALLRINRIIVAVTRLLVGINLVLPFPGIWATVLMWVGVGMIASHIVECLVFARLVKEHGQDNPALHFLKIFIYGYFHAATLMPAKKD
jgi:uncharacterized protein YhhL (DUF1145 family)